MKWWCNINTLKSSLEFGFSIPIYFFCLCTCLCCCLCQSTPSHQACCGPAVLCCSFPFATIPTKRSAVTFMFCTCLRETTVEQKRKSIAEWCSTCQQHLTGLRIVVHGPLAAGTTPITAAETGTAAHNIASCHHKCYWSPPFTHKL